MRHRTLLRAQLHASWGAPAGGAARAPGRVCGRGCIGRLCTHSCGAYYGRMEGQWRLELLGSARLSIGETSLAPERKAAAVLAYLAGEGPTPRTRLAGLLWPDSEESTARNNLTQTLRRLRLATKAEPVVGDNPVRLNDALDADVITLEQAALAGDTERLLGMSGLLLDGYDYDDCPEFELWRDSKRERFAQWRADAQQARVRQLEAQGRYADALQIVEQMLADDPLTETGYRTGMRLHYLAGDRGAALRMYARCREVLERELGVEPLPETEELATRIEKGGEDRGPRPPARKQAIPVEVLRPPRLVGREREWAIMEDAWAAGKGILLSGAPGSGKSRLMRDFLASKGKALQFAALPGDALVPYGTHARTYRQLLDLLEAEGATVPDWVLAELARIVPGLGPAPGPMDEGGKLRFYQAKTEALRCAIRAGYHAMGFDDLHNIDLASVEAGSYGLAQLRGTEGEVMMTVHAFRADEMGPELSEALGQVASSDGFVLIELDPLPPDAVSELLASLDLGGVEALAAPLERYTGGNPLFVLETLKHLIETGQLRAGSLPEGLPPPGKVQAVIQRRLRGLSPAAVRAMQAAAVLRTDFDLDVIGSLLKVDALELIGPWHELERAQVVRDSRFAHDLIQEAVHAELPAAVRALLHRRAAEVLAERGAAAARVAFHWQEAGDVAKSAPFLLRAAESAHHAFRHRDAADLYGRAADALEGTLELSGAFEAVYRQTTVLHGLDQFERLDAAVGRLFELARSDLERALAWQGRCDALRIRGNAAELEVAARSGLAVAEGLADPGPQTELTFSLAAALWLQGRVEETLEPLRLTLARIAPSPHRRLHAEVERWLGSSLSYLDRWEQADAYLARAKDLAEREHDRAKLAVVLSEIGLNALRASDARRASDALVDAWHILQAMEGVLDIKLASATMQASAWRARGVYDRACAVLDEAEAMGRDTGFLDMGFVLLERARCALDVGDLAGAEAAWKSAQRWPGLAETGRTLLATVRLDLLRASGDRNAAEAWAREVAPRAASEVVPSRLGPLLLALAAALPAAEGLVHAERALGLGLERNARGLEAAARVRKAQALLALGRTEEAVLETTAAVERVPADGIVQMTLGEVYFAHHLALRERDPASADAALERSRRWLQDPVRGITAGQRSAYLERHPLHRQILAA